MIQVIRRETPQKQSFGQKLGIGIGRGLETAGEMYKEHQAKKISEQEYQQENNQYKGLTGRDLSKNPVIRKMEIENFLKGELEEKKLLGKQSLLEGKQDFLTKLFGKNQEDIGAGNQTQISQTQQTFNPSKISDAQIAEATAIDPALGRELRAAKDTALRENRENRNFEQREKERSPEYQREQQLTKAQASADIEYNKKLQDSTKRTAMKRGSLERLEQMNRKGLTGKPFEKLLEKFGLIALTSEGRREFAAEVKNQFTDFKDIAGSQLTGMEFQTLTNAYPSPDFSQNANQAIIDNLKIVQDTLNEEHKIANQIKKENGGKIPQDFQSQVNLRLEDYMKEKSGEMKLNIRRILNEEYGITPGNILMFDPQGEPLDVPPEFAEYYLSQGATLDL